MLLTVCSDDLLQSRGARLQHGKLYSYVCHSIYRRASGGLGILPPLVAVVIFGECSFEGNFPRAWNKQCFETPSGYAAASAWKALICCHKRRSLSLTVPRDGSSITEFRCWDPNCLVNPRENSTEKFKMFNSNYISPAGSGLLRSLRCSKTQSWLGLHPRSNWGSLQRSSAYRSRYFMAGKGRGWERKGGGQGGNDFVRAGPSHCLWRIDAKAQSTLATMSKQRCRMLQVERFFRQSPTLLRRCRWCGRGLTVVVVAVMYVSVPGVWYSTDAWRETQVRAVARGIHLCRSQSLPGRRQHVRLHSRHRRQSPFRMNVPSLVLGQIWKLYRAILTD